MLLSVCLLGGRAFVGGTHTCVHFNIGSFIWFSYIDFIGLLSGSTVDGVLPALVKLAVRAMDVVVQDRGLRDCF